ncbi:MAG: hypothetical protein HFF83_04990 [Oscillibacter sp.]|nr:hypothetical protein [Oscillibacter sp.]
MLQILTCRMDLAAKYGTDAAIFLHNIVYWTLKNQSEERHFHEGRYWMQASLNGLAALYPLWSAPQIKRMIAKLRDAGVLLVGDFNEDRMVRTNWYSPSDEILALYDDGIDTAAIGRNRKMHGTKSSGVGTKSENANKDKEESKEDISPLTPQGADKLFDQFWSAYPKKKGKEQARKAWKKLAPDKDLCRQMAAALKWQKQSQEWRKDGGQFIPYPASWLNGRRWEDVPDQPDETEERYI